MVKIVTVLLRGLPLQQLRGQFTLESLARHLNEIFGKEEIGTFRVRELPGRSVIALDFDNGYDAMIAQSLLDKTPRILVDNMHEHFIRARITHKPEMMIQDPIPKPVQSSSDRSNIASDFEEVKDHKKTKRKIKSQLNMLKIKKKLINMEERLLEKELKKAFKKDKQSRSRSGHKAGTSREIRSMSTSSSDTDSSDNRSPPRRDRSRRIRSWSKERRTRSRHDPSYSKQSSRSRRDHSRTRVSRDSRSRSRNGGLHSERWRSRTKTIRDCSRSKYRRSSSNSRFQSRHSHVRTSRAESRHSHVRTSWVESRTSKCSTSLVSSIVSPPEREWYSQNRYETQEMPVKLKEIQYRPNISEYLEARPTPIDCNETAVGKLRNTSGLDTENASISSLDPLLNDLDLDLNHLEDEKPKIESDDKTEEGKISDADEGSTVTNVIITLVPIATATKQQQNVKQETSDENVYIMEDREYGYYVHITAKENPKKRYYLVKKNLIRHLKPQMKKYADHIEFKLFKFILELKLEEMISEVLAGSKDNLKTRGVIELLRKKYPEEKDEDFLLNTLCAIWRGEFNDSVRFKEKSSEVNLTRVKKEKQTDEPNVKTEKESPTVTNEKPKVTPKNQEIVVVEQKMEIIDLCDTEELSKAIKQEMNLSHIKQEIIELSDDDSADIAVKTEPVF